MHLIRENNVTFCNKTVNINDEFTRDLSKVTCYDCLNGRMNHISGLKEEIILTCHKLYKVPANINYFKRDKFKDFKAMDACIDNYNLTELFYGLTKPHDPLSK